MVTEPTRGVCSSGRARTSWLVAAAALALSAPAAHAAPTVSPLSLASTPSPFATCTIGLSGYPALDTNYVNAEVEPSVAVNPANPNNVIGAYQQDRWSGGGSRGLVTAYSFDGGTTWGHSFGHFSDCAGGTAANGGDYGRSSDPWVSIGPDGRAYEVGLAVAPDESSSAILASTSNNGGQSWSEPATLRADGYTVFNDKGSVTADPRIAGTAYAVWDRAEHPGAATIYQVPKSQALRYGAPWFAKTADGGTTWSARQISNQNIGTLGNQIVVEPDGTLVDVFRFNKGGTDAPHALLEGVMRSTDGGASWSPPIVVSNVIENFDLDPNNPNIFLRTGGSYYDAIPDIAVDPHTGKLYVVWEDARFSGGARNEIAMSTSTDEGLTWSAPVKVNQAPVSVLAFTPSVDVLPNGTVGITYYDVRNDPGNVATLMTDYFIETSHDGGATFYEARITPTSFDDLLAPYANGYMLGDYSGLAHDRADFKAFFVQTVDPSNPTDVFSATVAP
jgi:hypothetical protein